MISLPLLPRASSCAVMVLLDDADVDDGVALPNKAADDKNLGGTLPEVVRGGGGGPILELGLGML